MIDLEEVAVALDMFPVFDELQRAEIFHAIDVAPSAPLGSFAESEEYFEGEGYASWKRIRTYVLFSRTTLEEASGYQSAPTKDEIVSALHRADRMSKRLEL